METRTIVIADPDWDTAQVQEAGAALANGDLVIFPTETVYGLGASAVCAGAVGALSTLKDRRPDKPFTLHLGDPAQAERYAGPMPVVACRLARKAWPGPLTLVVPDQRPPRGGPSGLIEDALYHDGSVGLRCPDHSVATAILASAGVPVAATSANLRGQPAPRTASDAIAYFDGQVPLVVDAGPAQYPAASTVVAVRADNTFHVLREGALATHRVNRLARTSILFVCTGNMCRSPMAAGLAKQVLADTLGCRASDLPARGLDVASVGTSAMAGVGPSDNAIHAAADLGVDIRAHRSRLMTVDALRAADYIYVMTRGHRDAVVGLAPEAAPRVALVEPGGRDIQDPIGGDLAVYRACAARLREALMTRLREIV